MKGLGLVVCLACLCCTLATDSRIEPRPDGLWLVFSNTPANWVLERTDDLYRWETVLEGKSGFTTNCLIEFRIKSGIEAAFYRVRSVDPPSIP